MKKDERKTHCKRGHERTPDNVNRWGHCKKCSIVRFADWQKANPDKVRGFMRKYRYGLTSEQFESLKFAQRNACAICHKLFGEDRESRPIVDHNHMCCDGNYGCEKCVRGLLCRSCNVLLGYAHDNAEILRSAAAFLER